MTTSWNLPPGTTDADIDAAIEHEPEEELIPCSCCGQELLIEEWEEHQAELQLTTFREFVGMTRSERQRWHFEQARRRA